MCFEFSKFDVLADQKDIPLSTTSLPIAAPEATVSVRWRLVLRLSIEGDLRFISHRDTIRMMSRALVRAGLPVSYSKGFNPRIKMSLPIPRSVGMASEDELVVVELNGDEVEIDVESALKPQLPGGASFLDAQCLPWEKSIVLQSVVYELMVDQAKMAGLVDRASQLLKSTSAMVERHTKNTESKPNRLLDIRPYLVDLQLNRNLLSWTCRFLDHQTLAPREFLQALEFDWAKVRHHVKRKKVNCSHE